MLCNRRARVDQWNESRLVRRIGIALIAFAIAFNIPTLGLPRLSTTPLSYVALRDPSLQPLPTAARLLSLLGPRSLLLPCSLRLSPSVSLGSLGEEGATHRRQSRRWALPPVLRKRSAYRDGSTRCPDSPLVGQQARTIR